MTARTRKRFLVVMAAAAGVAVLLLHYVERDSYRCQVCSSTKDVFQWRLGSWMGASVPLTPTWERVTATRFLHDFLPAHHTHDAAAARQKPQAGDFTETRPNRPVGGRCGQTKARRRHAGCRRAAGGNHAGVVARDGIRPSPRTFTPNSFAAASICFMAALRWPL